MNQIRLWIGLVVILFCYLHSLAAYSQNHLTPAITQPIPISDLAGYDNDPDAVKNLISKAALLTNQNLTYMYNSADPKNHGMDCSGTIYYLLNTQGLKNLPRSANEMYLWVKQYGDFHSVKQNDLSSADFSELKPGDLLFWSGTYNIGNSNTISHVMIYLGKNSQNKPLMFGSSDGRTYQNKKMWGVSVFDFKLPGKNDSAKFIGYSCIPILTCKPHPVQRNPASQ